MRWPSTGGGSSRLLHLWPGWGYELYGGSVVSDASLGEMTDFQGEWYWGPSTSRTAGLGWGLGVGQTGLSSPTTCCSEIILAALPEEGVIISVQANFPGDLAAERRAFYAKEFATKVTRLARLLSDAATT